MNYQSILGFLFYLVNKEIKHMVFTVLHQKYGIQRYIGGSIISHRICLHIHPKPTITYYHLK